MTLSLPCGFQEIFNEFDCQAILAKEYVIKQRRRNHTHVIELGAETQLWYISDHYKIMCCVFLHELQRDME